LACWPPTTQQAEALTQDTRLSHVDVSVGSNWVLQVPPPSLVAASTPTWGMSPGLFHGWLLDPTAVQWSESTQVMLVRSLGADRGVHVVPPSRLTSTFDAPTARQSTDDETRPHQMPLMYPSPVKTVRHVAPASDVAAMMPVHAPGLGHRYPTIHPSRASRNVMPERWQLCLRLQRPSGAVVAVQVEPASVEMSRTLAPRG
jgi:hypothetical protein